MESVHKPHLLFKPKSYLTQNYELPPVNVIFFLIEMLISFRNEIVHSATNVHISTVELTFYKTSSAKGSTFFHQLITPVNIMENVSYLSSVNPHMSGRRGTSLSVVLW